MNARRWRKLGRLYDPTSGTRHPKLRTHAANPVPMPLGGDLFRVFYSGRDDHNRSSVGAVDIDVVRRQVVADWSDPVFVHGEPGTFHADGVSLGNFYRVGDVTYLLFMAWQTPMDGHWRGDIGRLIVTPELTLIADSPTPLMGADETDPISLSYPWVMANPAGGFDMWYGSTLTWDAGNGEMLHVIGYAQSSDGNIWCRKGPEVPHEIGAAQAFSRPTVVGSEVEGYHMWYSYRGAPAGKYRIGHAFSLERGSWIQTHDTPDIDVSPDGWDSEMIEYPFVFDHSGARYMLYNGNGYGKTGFGIAVLE